jgi:hypothetical protein
MDRETRGSGVAGMFTVRVATPVTIVPSGFVAVAVMAVVPFAMAVATPVVDMMEATEATLDLHVAAAIVAVPIVADWLVRFTVAPVDVVPMAISPEVCPATVSVCEAGTMASETSGSAGTPVTVRLAVAVTTELSGFVQIAVTGVVPWPTAVASPVLAPIEATPVLVTLHATPWVPLTPGTTPLTGTVRFT